MSKYTTGEIAKLCDVSVRTVQYYDARGILIPSQLSEGGRRLYSDDDLAQLKIICFLRDIGLPISSIRQLLSEEQPQKVLAILLQQQEELLQNEIAERQVSLNKLAQLKAHVKKDANFSVESINDIAYIMENKKRLRKMRSILLIVGIFMDLVEIGTLILWIQKGMWQPFVLSLCLVSAVGVAICYFYFKRIAYICPQCHTVFVPRFKDIFFARHTLNTRRLTCTACGHHGFCVEVYRKEVEKHD